MIARARSTDLYVERDGVTVVVPVRGRHSDDECGVAFEFHSTECDTLATFAIEVSAVAIDPGRAEAAFSVVSAPLTISFGP